MFYNLNDQSISDLKPDAIIISVEEIKNLESRDFLRPTRNYHELYDRVKKFRDSKTATIAFTSNIQPPLTGGSDSWSWSRIWYSLFGYVNYAVDKRMAPVLDRIYLQENIYKAFRAYQFEHTRNSVLQFDQNTKEANKRRKERAELNKKTSANQVQLSPVMPVLIPDIGTKMVLAEDWQLILYDESRNGVTLEITEAVPSNRNWNDRHNDPKNTNITFPKGTILSVDRIYIRKGAADFSSLTFFADKKTKIIRDGKEYTSPKALRFWAKLKDVNNMKVQFVEETVVK